MKLIFLFLILKALLSMGCASRFEIPQQTYSGAISPQIATSLLSERNKWSASSKKISKDTKPKVILMYSGLDQFANTRMPRVEAGIIPEFRDIKKNLLATGRISDLEIMSRSYWDHQSIEDLRKTAVIYRAQYMILTEVSYDFRSFYSTFGQFVGWIPYVNFVAPIYKLEGRARIESLILDVKTGALIPLQTHSTVQHQRSSSWFMQEHFLFLSKDIHEKMMNDFSKTLIGWVNG